MQFFQQGGEGRFVDRFDALWRLVPTGDPTMPLQIVLLEKSTWAPPRPGAPPPATATDGG